MAYWPWEDWIDPTAETLRRLRHIAMQNDQILANQEFIMSDLSAIQNAVAAEATVEDSAIVLLQQLAADVSAAANDPVAIQAIVDNINTNAAALAAAVSANTPAAPADAPPVPPVVDPNAPAPALDATAPPADTTPPADAPPADPGITTA